MSEVLPSQKSDLLSILIRASLVGMLVQPETVPTEGSDEFVCPTAQTDHRVSRRPGILGQWRTIAGPWSLLRTIQIGHCGLKPSERCWRPCSPPGSMAVSTTSDRLRFPAWPPNR